VQGSVAYRYETIKISDPSDGATQDLLDEVGEKGVSSMEFGLSFDTRDNVFDPLKGDLLTSSWSVAGGPFGADKDFWKFFGRASHYVPLVNGSVLEFRGRIGLADPYSNTKKVPIYERYFAGGAETIRGYRERKIGPVDPNSKDPLGGNAMLVGNVEYTYPLFSFLKVACFYDIGNVWQNMRDICSGKDTTSPLNEGGFKSGLGFGVRIKTPIGPVRLDYGIPMNKESGEQTKGSGRFHFSMSHGF
jgi:outer membrane protein insertion porin family